MRKRNLYAATLALAVAAAFVPSGFAGTNEAKQWIDKEFHSANVSFGLTSAPQRKLISSPSRAVPKRSTVSLGNASAPPTPGWRCCHWWSRE